MARLCPLFSGSGGNSYYIGSRSAGLLIDAGRSARQLDRMLQRCGIDPMAIQGHPHHPRAQRPHRRGAGVAKSTGIPVFASQGTLLAMQPLPGRGWRAGCWRGPSSWPGMEVTPFATPHDSAQSLGFRIQTADGRQFALATDLGVVTPLRAGALLGAEFVVLESNHDREMLRNGPYPAYLKRRILAGTGHLSNGDCAAFLPELARAGAKRFLLAHLSGENNTPSLGPAGGRQRPFRRGVSGGDRLLAGRGPGGEPRGQEHYLLGGARMLAVKLICVGKLKESYWRDAVAEYEKRLRPCASGSSSSCRGPLAQRPLPGEIEAALEKEGEPNPAPRRGEGVSPVHRGEGGGFPGLAKRLAGPMQSPGAVSFVIGSSHGLSPRVKAAGEGLSMSPMTFPHQLARVMLCEQIYPGLQILGGHKYHK